MDKHQWLLSCDWGTSSCRVRLIDAQTRHAEATWSGDNGVASVYDQWTLSGTGERGRAQFFLSALKDAIHALQQLTPVPLEGLPVVISGMASSTIGMMELPYSRLPLSLKTSSLEYRRLPASDQFPHAVWLISGACTGNDILRGEEVQVIGACADLDAAHGTHLCILPGTHAKHVRIDAGHIATFETYMTGEFFALLSRHSILKQSLAKSAEGLKQRSLRQSFERGIATARDGNLLHDAFLVRSLSVLNKALPEENYYFLSGLLIGTELRDLTRNAFDQLVVVGSEELIESYHVALTFLQATPVLAMDAGVATVRGHCKLLEWLS